MKSCPNPLTQNGCRLTVINRINVPAGLQVQENGGSGLG